jgi:hypothetical protein
MTVSARIPHLEVCSGLHFVLRIFVVQLIWPPLINPTSEVQEGITKEEEKL